MKNSSRLFILALVIAGLLLSVDVYAKPAKFEGTFKNAEAGLHLEAVRSNDNVYKGKLKVQGKVYAFEGVEVLGVLTATYAYDGEMALFILSEEAGKINMLVDGQILELTQEPEGSKVAQSNGGITHNSLSQVQPAAGKQIQDPFGGYSFRIPSSGWEYSESGGVFNLTRNGDSAIFNVSTHNYVTKKQAMEDMGSLQPIQDERSQTYLTPSVSDWGKDALRISFTGTIKGRTASIESLNSFSPYGGGVSFVLMLFEAKTDEHLAILQSMLLSTQFMQPKKSAEAIAWAEKLRGKRLLYLNTGGGSADETKINLYADGNYDFFSANSYQSGGYAEFSYADQNRGKGTWKVVSRGAKTVLLLFDPQNGHKEFVIQPGAKASELMANNRRYFIQNLE